MVAYDKHICSSRYVVVSGRITEIRHNIVFNQLTLELDVTGSRFEFYSRQHRIIHMIMNWYAVRFVSNLTAGMSLTFLDELMPGKRVTIDVIKTLEIIGCR